MGTRKQRNKRLMLLLSAVGALAAQPATSGSEKPLDYMFFKNRVEPIFLKRRGEHARCYVCHEEGRNRLRLEKLTAGATSWTEDQSRRNFEAASHLVVPGNPLKSRLLMHPLAPEAGGDPSPMGVHYGGRQFASIDDPDWKTLAEWVNGQKASPPALNDRDGL